MIIVSILIQLVILVIAMVIAGLIIRWIVANPHKCKSLLSRTKRKLFTPLIVTRATRAYINWKRVKMKFTLTECISREWEKYDNDNTSDQPYYRR